MDLSFGRAGFDIGTATVRLDYPQLVAILSSTQATSRTARTAGRLSLRGETASGTLGALVALFDPGAGWIAAARALGGSFNPEIAGKAR